jgi:hypothetical protein
MAKNRKHVDFLEGQMPATHKYEKKCYFLSQPQELEGKAMTTGSSNSHKCLMHMHISWRLLSSL